MGFICLLLFCALLRLCLLARKLFSLIVSTLTGPGLGVTEENLFIFHVVPNKFMTVVKLFETNHNFLIWLIE